MALATLLTMRDCSVAGCDRLEFDDTLCAMHWRRWRASGDPLGRTTRRRACSIEGCGRPHIARGFCFMHYMRWRRHGDPLVVLRECAPRKPRQRPARVHYILLTPLDGA